MDCCLDLAGRGLLVALQDLGAAGLTSAPARWRAGAGWASHRPGPGSRCASRAWRRPRSSCPRARSGCSPWSSPARLDEVAALCAATSSTPTASARSPRATGWWRGRRRDRGRRPGAAAGRRCARIRRAPRSRRPPPRPSTWRPCPSRTTSAAAWLGPARPAQRREQALGVRALRPAGRREHRPPPGRRRRRGAAARQHAGHRHDHRLRRAPLPGRSARRGSGGGAARPPATSPAPGPGPSPPPTASTSPTPRRAPPGWRLAETIAGMAEALPGAGGAHRLGQRVPLQ